MALSADKVRGVRNSEIVWSFAAALSAAPRPYAVRRGGGDLVVFCFATPEDAQAFCDRFYGDCRAVPGDDETARHRRSVPLLIRRSFEATKLQTCRTGQNLTRTSAARSNCWPMQGHPAAPGLPLLAHGFNVDILAELVRDRLATAHREPLKAGERQIEAARIRITAAGRDALAAEG